MMSRALQLGFFETEACQRLPSSRPSCIVELTEGPVQSGRPRRTACAGRCTSDSNPCQAKDTQPPGHAQQSWKPSSSVLNAHAQPRSDRRAGRSVDEEEPGGGGRSSRGSLPRARAIGARPGRVTRTRRRVCGATSTHPTSPTANRRARARIGFPIHSRRATCPTPPIERALITAGRSLDPPHLPLRARGNARRHVAKPASADRRSNT